MILKNIFFVIFFSTIGLFTMNAQEFSRANSTSILKKGIYRNFEEFKNNTPSIQLVHEVMSKEKKTSGVLGEGMTSFFYLNIGKEAAKKIGRVYGFCDGKNIYINEFNPKLKSNVLFMKVGFINSYCFFEYKAFNGINSLLKKNRVINMNTGELIIVSKKALVNKIAYNTNVVIHSNLQRDTVSLGK